MSSLEEGLYDLGRLDQLAYQDTPMHRLDPRAKVVTALVFIVCVVSFGKYDLLAMAPFVIYPVFTAAEGNLPFDFLARKLLIAAPFAFFVGIFNPLFDTATFVQVGAVSISGGWVSFAAIMFRFFLTISAALVLIGTTSFNGVCMGLERLGMPDVLATQLLFLYRYIFVLGEETMRMSRARASRSFGKRGMGHACLQPDPRPPAASHLRSSAARVPGDARARLRRPRAHHENARLRRLATDSTSRAGRPPSWSFARTTSRC